MVFPDGETPPGKLVEFNGSVMANYVREWGGEPRLLPVVKDDPEAIKAALLAEVEHLRYRHCERWVIGRIEGLYGPYHGRAR